MKPTVSPSTSAISYFEIAAIQSSFRTLSKNQEHAAALFYTRLFEFDPALRSVCTHDLPTQSRALMRVLGLIVQHLDSPEAVREHMRDYTARNTQCALAPHHFHCFGAALFWMLEQMLGECLTPEIYSAWMKAFTVVTKSILAGHSAQMSAA